MAIAFDAASNNYSGSSTSTYTVAHTCTGTNRLLLVGVEGITPTGITYNGTSMTFYGAVSGQTMVLYYLIAPSTGTNNIVVSFSGTSDLQVFGASYTGVSQSGFPDAGDVTQTSGGNITFTLTTVADNCWMFSMMRNTADGTGIASTNTTDRSSGTRYFSAGDTNAAQTPAGSHSMSWTTTRNLPTTFGIVASFAPVGAAAPATNGSFLLNFV